MRLLTWIVLLSLLPALAPAKVHFINKGVRYHIGDNRFALSEDSNFMDAYPVVGEQWVQAFTVSEPDTVKIRIANIWGVDDCPYCKVLVQIDGYLMGRLSEENNRQPFDTPTPLAYRVEPGRTYYIKITSIGEGGSVDDFAIEGVSVETVQADVTFVGPVTIHEPERPIPTAQPTPMYGPCPGAEPKGAWLPSESKAKGYAVLNGTGQGTQLIGSAPLAEGGYVDIHVKVQSVAQGDQVGQAIEVGLGEGRPGWVLSFGSGSQRPFHGNMRGPNRYLAANFAVSAWRDGWNLLRLARCPGGRTLLQLNGRSLADLPGLPDGPADISVRTLGVSAWVADSPQAK